MVKRFIWVKKYNIWFIQREDLPYFPFDFSSLVYIMNKWLYSEFGINYPENFVRLMQKIAEMNQYGP